MTIYSVAREGNVLFTSRLLTEALCFLRSVNAHPSGYQKVPAEISEIRLTAAS